MTVREKCSLPAPLLHILLSIPAQLGGYAAALLLNEIAAYTPDRMEVILGVMQPVLHGCAAYAFARLFSLPGAWCVLNALIPIALSVAAAQFFPSSLAGMVLLALMLIYLPTLWTRVPYYPTSRSSYEEIARIVASEKAKTFIDLGCGFGTLLAHLAKRFPDKVFEGVEVGLLPYIAAKLHAAFYPNMTVSYRSLWGSNLSRYDIVYAFLSPDPMPRLWQKVQQEMPKGGAFLVNTFRVDAKPEMTLEINDRRSCILYLYRVKSV